MHSGILRYLSQGPISVYAVPSELSSIATRPSPMRSASVFMTEAILPHAHSRGIGREHAFLSCITLRIMLRSGIWPCPRPAQLECRNG